MTGALLALAAGALTLINPCVLPLLPIIVGAAFQEHKWGPVAIAAGLTTSFTVIGVSILAFGFSIGIDETILRQAGALLLLIFGLVLLVPALQSGLTTLAAPLTSGAGGLAQRISAPGLPGQFAIGSLLGIVWAPCAGPTLGAAIASASQGKNLGEAFFIFGFFGLGISLALIAFAYASRATLAGRKKTLQRFSGYAKPLFGALLVSVGVMIVSGADKYLETKLLEVMPMWLIQITTSI